MVSGGVGAYQALAQYTGTSLIKKRPQPPEKEREPLEREREDRGRERER